LKVKMNIKKIRLFCFFLKIVVLSFCSFVFLSCNVQAKSGNLKANGGISVLGTREFENQINEALLLLEEKAPEAYEIVLEYIGVIKQSEKSGMNAYTSPPTYEIADRTAFYSVTWCAGSIAHDSIHSKLYNDYKDQHSTPVPDDIWTGQKVELECIKHQIEVMQKIDAPKHEIKHLKDQNGMHFDLNDNGKYDAEDYELRDW